MSKRVTVLLGGWSSEREVSLSSGKAAVAALEEAGFTVTPLDPPRDAAALANAITATKPDVVFNALHGTFGEDGRIQGLLDIMGLPYTHSGLTASALAMDKPIARKIFEAEGMAVPEGMVVRRGDLYHDDPIDRPYVIKPLAEGSSVGVRIIWEEDGDEPFADDEGDADEPVLIEAFISGREFTVAVMGDEPLGVTEIITGREFYDYEAKYETGGSRHILPADLDDDETDEIMALAVAAHAALGCRGVSRADFRYDGEDFYILEVNTQPGMTPTSLVPEQAEAAGISFSELCTWMVEEAKCGD